MTARPHTLLTPAEKTRLRHLLEAIERDTGTEIAVLAVPHVHDVEHFARTYFDHVGLGKRDRHNGILVLLVLDRRLARIEVGRGLGDAVRPDDAQRIIEHVLAPQLRHGRYGEGILRTVEALGHLARASS